MHEEKDFGTSRRKFLAGSLAGMAAAGLPSWLVKSAEAAEGEQIGRSRKRFGPNDTIQVGLIGCRQGVCDAEQISKHEGAKIVAICDVDSRPLDEALKKFGPDCKGYKDFREFLERKDIDAVIVAPPDHWHALICAAAMKAGKDVYCEKPLTLTIAEGRKLVNVSKETKRILQVGSQQRSDSKFRLACELVRNGRIGRVKRVEVHLPGGAMGGPFEPEPVPPELDWNMWLGPAFYVDFIPQRIYGGYRCYLEYGGGTLTDWGAHHNDIVQWGLGMDRSGPLQVEASGVGPDPGRNCYNIFPQYDIHYVYPGGITVLVTTRQDPAQGECGIHFIGDEGWIFVSRGLLKASEQRLLDEPLPASAIKLYNSDYTWVPGDWIYKQTGNLLDCMRTRKQPVCDVETGHRSATVCHLGNISLRLGGRKLQWDPKKEMFPNDPEANLFVSRPKRPPWKL